MKLLNYNRCSYIASSHFPLHSPFITYHQIYTKAVTSRAGTGYPSGTPEFTPDFQSDACCAIFRFLCSVLQVVVRFFVLFLLPLVVYPSTIDGFRLSLWYIQTLLVIYLGDFMDINQLLTQKLLNQGYVAPRLNVLLQKFYGRHHNQVDQYEISNPYLK